MMWEFVANSLFMRSKGSCLLRHAWVGRGVYCQDRAGIGLARVTSGRFRKRVNWGDVVNEVAVYHTTGQEVDLICIHMRTDTNTIRVDLVTS